MMRMDPLLLRPFLSLCLCASVVALALLALTLGGCLVASSSSSYETGRQVTSSTLAKIELGVTTENWLIGALGEPTSRQVVAEGSAGIPAREPEEVRDQTSEVSSSPETAGTQEQKEEDSSDTGVPAGDPSGGAGLPTRDSEPKAAAGADVQSPLPLGEGEGEGDSSPPGPRPAERTGVVEILRYDWSRRAESGGAFFLIFSGSETRTERSSAWFEITDGVVTDYGVE